MPRRLNAVVLVAALSVLLLAAPLRAGEGKSPDAAWASGLAYLVSSQQEDGSWGGNPTQRAGVTAVVLEAWTHAPDSVRAAHPHAAAAMTNAARWLAAQQRASGAIATSEEYQNYTTAHAITALSRFDRETFEPVIAKAVAWLRTGQMSEAAGYDPEQHVTYGGFGYGSSIRPDLNNTWIALTAFHEAGVPKDDPLWARANVFIRRCHNSSEVNDQPYAGDDGGSMYLPNESPAGWTETRDGRRYAKSYGSISAAMLGSYLMTGEPRDGLPVRTILGWIEENFTLDKNPGTGKDGQEGLFGFYLNLARSLHAYGTDTVGDTNWREALTGRLLQLQQEDGSWSNEVARWAESDKDLVTGYALTALGLAQQPARDRTE